MYNKLIFVNSFSCLSCTLARQNKKKQKQNKNKKKQLTKSNINRIMSDSLPRIDNRNTSNRAFMCSVTNSRTPSKAVSLGKCV